VHPQPLAAPRIRQGWQRYIRCDHGSVDEDDDDDDDDRDDEDEDDDDDNDDDNDDDDDGGADDHATSISSMTIVCRSL